MATHLYESNAKYSHFAQNQNAGNKAFLMAPFCNPSNDFRSGITNIAPWRFVSCLTPLPPGDIRSLSPFLMRAVSHFSCDIQLSINCILFHGESWAPNPSAVHRLAQISLNLGKVSITVFSNCDMCFECESGITTQSRPLIIYQCILIHLHS